MSNSPETSRLPPSGESAFAAAMSPRHPPGLYTLFFTEMWERCSYYGMRALLILFMTAAVQKGGLGFSDPMAGAIMVVALIAVLLRSGVIGIDPVWTAQTAKWVIVALAVLTFLRLLLARDLDAVEKKRIGVVAVLFVAAAMFFAGLEQAGSSFNLFAERHTDRIVAGWEMPAGWFQMINPLFVVILAPLAANMWVTLSKRDRDLSLGMKFSLGAQRAVAGRVWCSWLLLTYLLHTVGELCVSPVGLSSITKLAPARMVGQIMGLWFMATALGNLIAGLIAGQGSSSANQMAGHFWWVALSATGIGVFLLVLSKPMRRWMAGVK